MSVVRSVWVLLTPPVLQSLMKRTAVFTSTPGPKLVLLQPRYVFPGCCLAVAMRESLTAEIRLHFTIRRIVNDGAPTVREPDLVDSSTQSDRPRVSGTPLFI